MAFLAKSTVLKAYHLLSDIDTDKRQGLTQKVSALKYASALDMFYKSHKQNCDLKQSRNKDWFSSYVGEIVKINEEYNTKDFFLSVSSNGRDFDCGSNFFSQSSVKDSKTNPISIFQYPKRSGWKPVMDVQNQELVYRPEYLVDAFTFYLASFELRLAFIIWVLRFTEIPEENMEGLKSALGNIFTIEFCNALYLGTMSSVDASYIEFDKERCRLSREDVLSLFNSGEQHSCKNFTIIIPPLQQIFYGAPGTGKSHEIDGKTNDDNSIRTTFHPDTDYATFVGAYKPMMDTVDEYALDATGKTHQVVYPNGKNSIVYKYEPQVFLKAYVEAWKRYLNKQEGEDDSYYLVIEEINRGNCAQIFGDLFQLLDREDSGYSSYAISPESAITKYLAEDAQSADGTKFSDLEFSDVTKKRGDVEKIIATAGDLKAGKRLVLPPNLRIWATMNTSDQSLFPIDSAFKRRWDWKYMPIKYDNNDWKIVLGDLEYPWTAFQKEINKRIYDATNSEDKQMGDWFVRAEANKISESLLLNKIVFYLWNDICKDGEGDIFNIKTPDSKTEPIIFSKFFDGTTTEKLQQWMDYLKVTPGTDNQENDADQTDATTETENE